SAGRRAEGRTGGIVASALGVAPAVLVKMPVLFGIDLNHDAGFYTRNLGFFVLPLLTGYFVWKRRLTTSTVRWLAAAFVAAGVFAHVYPFVPPSHTQTLTPLPPPIPLLPLVGLA